MNHFNKKAGIKILGIIILAVITILLLNYFHISIKIVADNSAGQENINHLGEVVKNFWDTILHYWNTILIPLFWKPFISGMNNIWHSVQ